MSLRLAPVAALIACLSGCTALADLKLPVAATAKTAATMKVPEAKAAPVEAAKPAPVADAAGVVTAGQIVARPSLRIPEDFGVSLPSTLIGEGGAGVISNDGHSVVSNDGNSFGLLAADGGLSTSAGAVVRSYGIMYEASRKGAKALLELAKANEDDLQAGKEVPLLGLPGVGSLAMSLRTFNDHAELTFWAGDGAGRHRFLWLSYTDEKHGRGIFHPVVTESPYVFATTFDLTKNQAEADAYFMRDKILGHSRLHISVATFPGSAADAPALKLRVGGFMHDAAYLKEGAVVASANVLRSNTAAAIYGVRPKGQAAFAFKNSTLGDAPAGAHGLFLDSDGNELNPATITAVQRAAVPPDDDVTPPAFTDPVDVAPLKAPNPDSPNAPTDATFADPAFSFPSVAP
jgi:hypothetical protein